MPQGLQCFNSDGNIVVDLTDKQLTLFKSITVADAIAPMTVAQYFGAQNNVPPVLTLAGVDPVSTVAFAAIKQPGTEKNIVRMQKVTVTIIGVDSYILNIFEDFPGAQDIIHFYKFR